MASRNAPLITPGKTYCGVLMPLRGHSTVVDDNSHPTKIQHIEFPAMPDEIVLRRAATYNSKSPPLAPDGIHVYTGTEPLQIEFSFRLHHTNADYCREGPYALINVAARLHAMVLPIIAGSRPRFTVNLEYNNQAGSNADIEKRAAATVNLSNLTDAGNATPPAICRLELLDGGGGRYPGIHCIGYVKDVGVKFLGPFMRGRGDIFNLPSAAEYSFTFVHSPGQGNLVYFEGKGPVRGVTGNANAYAQDVQEVLYFTRGLSRQGGAVYQGINPIPGPSPKVQRSITVRQVPNSTFPPDAPWEFPPPQFPGSVPPDD